MVSVLPDCPYLLPLQYCPYYIYLYIYIYIYTYIQAAIRKNIAKEHQNEILGQIDEARNKMRREMELAALELEASRREEAAYQVELAAL